MMEIFREAQAVQLKSHLDKYLVADDDQSSVRQSRNGINRRARWLVEIPDDNPNVVRLKSCHGKYLAASEIPFLLGMTGKRALQAEPGLTPDRSYIEWEPVRDGFLVKLKTRAGKFLRANGGTPPWRNSVTHDVPHKTKGWVLWEVQKVAVPENDGSSLSRYMNSMASSLSNYSSVSDEASGSSDDQPASPMSVISVPSPRLSFTRSGMEFFHNAKAVRLRSHHDKYLLADDDEESVSQDRNGSSKYARWTVEFVPDLPNIIRLKSCCNKYLTASNQPFLLGMTGRKVTQTLPKKLDSSVEWEPVREGSQVKLKTRYGHFLRANGGLPPWRNSITHDIPHRTATQEWVLWDVDIVQIQVVSPTTPTAHKPSPVLDHRPSSNSDSKSRLVNKPPVSHSPSRYDKDKDADSSHSDSFASDSGSVQSSSSFKSVQYGRQESNDSMGGSGSPPKMEGRTVYYHVASDEYGDDEDANGGFALTFNGTDVRELTHKLERETGLDNIIVCTRSPLNKQLYPLRLQLPPNITMHVIVVPASSKVASDLARSGIIL